MDVSGSDPQKVSQEAVVMTQEENDCPIEQVRLTVPTTDDPTLPCLTFRTWFLGIISCGVLAFLNQFFGYRQNALTVSSVLAQIVVLPVARMMEASLPREPIRILGTRWSFSLNPGPFNMKEHVLITIFANAGSSSVYAVGIITIVKAFYHTEIHPLAAMLLTQSTQFFMIVLISSFSYYIVPNYLFQSITALSFVCWIWKDSFKAQQIGSGLKGFGIGSFGLDWATVASFLGSPLATPGFAMMNMLVGYIIIFYMVIPLSYWNNWYQARRFPMYSFKTYNADGTIYNVSKVLNQSSFSFNQAGYDDYGKVNLSILFVLAYGLSFATLAATISHVLLFHGRTIWEQTKASMSNKFGDVHTRLMKKNYDPVPQWWFHSLLIVVIGLALLTCEGFGRQLQLPYWGIILAICLASVFTLPVGVIVATTNQGVGLNVITELIIGYMYPGRPLANVVFKTYGDNSMRQAIQFLGDFKLGHYMKIPPKSMFIVQLAGTFIASSVYFATSWWLLTTVEFICDPSKLPTGSPWTCPGDDVFYNASIIWGLVGPQRMFGNLGLYSKMNYFFLFGILAPVPFWFLSRKFPEWKWVRLVNIPILINCPGPPIKPVNYNMWFAVGMFFNFVVYKRFKSWWARHNYILSAGLDAGVAFMAILCYLVLQNRNINGPEWWGLEVDDHCPLANCPSVPGILVEGCPIVQ
ncbi:Oligopeptide transporter OPT superfamily [Cynara cardunculus var. scolymus]|uniref:Oligopeptide transporter OPT superfamily n=1 Tax=Cynara cardunculus var. scolymus TaxID=59895 RepID=A0A124SDE8_CYNCS|nr:Oligopeptide transporter OPT superfamily [Cynara cardunculus var. scolymus]